MSETNHTPAPWTARLDYGRHWISAGKGRKAVQIADVSDVETGAGSGEVDTDHARTQANARLIAAAPELLAALERALAGVMDPEARRQAKAAIARAKAQ